MSTVRIDLSKVRAARAGSAYRKSNSATMWIDKKTGMVNLRTPYEPGFMDAFRLMVPEGDRKWDKENKIWKFSPQFIDRVVAIAEKAFTLEMLPEISASADSDADKLLRHLSLDGLAKVWRIVAGELHPDKGGSAEAFIEAKNAYDNMAKGGK